MTGAATAVLVTLLCLAQAPISNMRLPGREPPAETRPSSRESTRTAASPSASDMAWRGAFFTPPPGTAWVRTLAEAKVNMVMLPMDGAFDAEALRGWAPVFEAARAAGIEPVPVLGYPWRADDVLRAYPGATEGLMHAERIALRGEARTPLAKRNVLTGDGLAISISYNRLPCTPGVDYGVEPGFTHYPFSPENDAWHIYRMPGGRIPEGAEVIANYAYAPPGSAACCPRAPETAAAVDDFVRRLAQALKPRFVVAGHGGITRIGACGRCANAPSPGAEHYAGLMRLLHAALAKHLPEAQLLLWGEELHPRMGAAPAALEGVLHALPEDIALIAPLPDTVVARPLAEAAWLDAFDTLGRRYLAVTLPNARSVAALAQRAGEGTRQLRGVLIAGGASKARDALRPGSHGPPWPTALSRYFDADIEAPSEEALLTAFTQHINTEAVRGRMPAFDALKPFENAPGMMLYRNLLRYSEIEAAFTAGDRDRALREVGGLVKGQTAVARSMTEERAERIIETVNSQGLFVPSSILFGAQLLPLRESAQLTPQPAFELPVEPAYTDETGAATAEIDFGLPAHLVRMDYVTTLTNRVVLEYDTGSGFSAMGQWQAPADGYVRGPVLLRQPLRTARVRLRAESAQPQAVLRELRVFAHKPPSRSFAPGQRADAFLLLGGSRFPAAATEVTAHRESGGVVFDFIAHEPRMHGMLARSAAHDMPLWEEESVELRLRAADGTEIRLLVNPLGARYDSWRGDTAWDGPWTAETAQNERSWTARIRLPHEIAVNIRHINFLRHRVNAITETSAWALDLKTGLPGYALWE